MLTAPNSTAPNSTAPNSTAPNSTAERDAVPVIGVGLDVVDVAGFADQLGRPGTRFANSSFTSKERAEAGDAGSGQRLAARWAAKEAFLKAWSSARYGAPPALSTW